MRLRLLARLHGTGPAMGGLSFLIVAAIYNPP